MNGGGSEKDKGSFHAFRQSVWATEEEQAQAREPDSASSFEGELSLMQTLKIARSKVAAPLPKRRTLDDMRRLSDQILKERRESGDVTAKELQKPPK